MTEQETIQAMIAQWEAIRTFWRTLAANRIEAAKGAKLAKMTDLQIVEAVSDLAWALAATDGNVAPFGTRMDRSRQEIFLAKWKMAVAIFEKASGINGQEALVRHETMIRDKDHAPELHIDRR